MTRPMISVVVPVYGCPEAVAPLCERTARTVEQITNEYEIILVNDGCPKGSWNEITKVCGGNSKIVGINLSRNFGQLSATNAGLDYSTGEYVVLMDCDLQDRPEHILTLWNKMQEGYDIVFGERKERKDNFLAKGFSKAFYRIYNRMVEGYFNPDVCNYCMVARKVVDEFCALPEHNKSYTTILSWMGYRRATIPLESDERYEGKSSYTLHRKINLAIDMITFQSNKPLLWFIKFGVAIGCLSIIFIIYQLCVYFIVGGAPSGWMSLIAVVCLLGGVQLAALGVIGIYIGNIFNETKNRKSYFIQDILNGRDEHEL